MTGPVQSPYQRVHVLVCHVAKSDIPGWTGGRLPQERGSDVSSMPSLVTILEYHLTSFGTSMIYLLRLDLGCERLRLVTRGTEGLFTHGRSTGHRCLSHPQ